MVDFVYRECRHVTKGPLAFLRIGTCGGIRPDMPVGTICVSKSSVFCGTNYNAFLRSGASVEERYNISDPVSADAELTEHVHNRPKKFRLIFLASKAITRSRQRRKGCGLWRCNR